jgi:four helix bundle protein
LRIIRLFRALPRGGDAQVIGKEFAARVGIVMEEADETVFWLELIGESGILPMTRLEGLLKEARELSAIFTVSYSTARSKKSIAQLPDYPITQ